MKKILLFSILSAILLSSTVNAVKDEAAVGLGLAAGVATGAAVRQVLLRKWSREIDASHEAQWRIHGVSSGITYNYDIANAKLLSTVLGVAAGAAATAVVANVMDDHS
ncbi:hypothetical protein A3F66_05555 [candidate division TM6 bacterium RIFCSPHIGHO2_12_FULL_32_22]|nr:MAG: hypothetical protein A3F66_05555 [candidate division TM6 bacterium RIFCSPHIGHO2_12_FULL_32_22]